MTPIINKYIDCEKTSFCSTVIKTTYLDVSRYSDLCKNFMEFQIFRSVLPTSKILWTSLLTRKSLFFSIKGKSTVRNIFHFKNIIFNLH